MDQNKKLSREIAAQLLSIKAVKLQPESPFTWASGWKSPIYCDNRITLSYPALRTKVKESFCERIKDKYPEVDVIAGVATAGIPQGALIAEELGLPYIYVRSKPKAHGMTNMIEGEVMPDKNVVVIEDLISTGGSSINAIDALRMSEMNVLGLASIFTYGFDIADENMQKADVDYFTLSNYNDLLDVALKTDAITAEQLISLSEWRQNPSVWVG